MKYAKVFFIIVLLYSVVRATSSFDSQSNRLSQQPINFYGSVKTRQGNEHQIENITINGKFRDIMLYEKPQNKVEVPDKEFVLTADPHTTLAKAHINLDEVERIDVPEKLPLWTYQKKEGERKSQYLEIHITKKGSDRPQSYLLQIEYDDQLAFYTIFPDGKPQKMTLPLRGLATLVIGGYCTQEAGAPSCVPSVKAKQKGLLSSKKARIEKMRSRM